ncbi:MAG: hypothetical protein GEU71_04465 [Actinobacteria bacterium]|nr:hypothetical protein [Actinomycetota bacterium]
MAMAARRRGKPRERSRGFGTLPRVVIATLILGVIGAMAIEPTRQLIEQRQRIAAMSSDVQEIESSNAALEARIDRLKDPDYIEQRARAQIGLILPGETSLLVMPPSRKAQKRQAEREAAAAARAAEPEVEKPGAIESFLNFIGF